MDQSYADTQEAFFPLLEDPLAAGPDLGQALDPWQTLALPEDFTSVIPPFSNVNYLE